MKYILAIGLATLALNAHAVDLFAKGAETFKIENTKGQTPTFRVLSDSMTKQALAMAAVGALNADDSVKPKLPMNPYVDLKFETLTLTPKGKDALELRLKLSGYKVDLDKTISKKDLLAGKTIVVPYPKEEREVAMYTVNSSGVLKLHLKDQTLVLENVEAKMSFESPLGDDGSEAVQFSGTARRLL